MASQLLPQYRAVDTFPWSEKKENGLVDNQNVIQKNRCPASSRESLRSGWHSVLNFEMPVEQGAVLTPTVSEKLALKYQIIPTRQPASGEVVVKLYATGLCSSDIMFSLGLRSGYPTHNNIAGHEGIGQVVVAQDESLIGKPVAARFLAYNCRHCHACLHDIPESCPDQRFFPRDHLGTYQEYITAPMSSLMPVPDFVLDNPTTGPRLSHYTAALCSGAAASKALRKLDPRPGDVVVISGISGAIGHLAGQIAKNVYKAKVIGVDLPEKKHSLGPRSADCYDIFVPASQTTSGSFSPSFIESISRACSELRGSGEPLTKADGLIVTAGSASAYISLIDYLREGGCIVCVGVPKYGGDVSFPIADVIEKQIRIQGVLMGGWEESYRIIQYIKSGLVRPIVTEIDLRDVPSYTKRFLCDGNAGKLVVNIASV